MLDDLNFSGDFNVLIENSLGERNNRNLWHRRLLSDDIMKPLLIPINNLSHVSCSESPVKWVVALGIRGCVWERVIVVAGMTITQS